MRVFDKIRQVMLALMVMIFCIISTKAICATLPGTYNVQSTVTYFNNGIEQNPSIQFLPFTVDAADKTAEISFKAFSPFGEAEGNVINGTDISVSGTNEGPFVPVSTDPLIKYGLSKGAPIPLINVNVVRDGQLVFIRLKDTDRNNNSNEVDTAIVSVNTIKAGLTAQNFDNVQILDPNLVSLDGTKVIRLYETDSNSGIFMGYVIFRVETITNNNQPEIVVNNNTLIAVSYQENNTGITEQDFLNFDGQVSAEGRVFNTLTGRLIDGMRVSLIDAVDSVPAQVFASDGQTQFPSEFVTGTDTPDANGGIVNVNEGEYIFPYVNPGQYRLRITNLASSFIFPSTATQEEIFNVGVEVPIIENGSFGEVFTINSPRSVGIDLPVDTLANVTVQKYVDKSSASPGDMVVYTIDVTNHERSSLSNMTLIDDAPLDMRYLAGSLSINGTISNNIAVDEQTGRMIVTLPQMNQGDVLQVRYAMRLLPKIKDGTILRNSAQVIGSGGFISNIAQADIRVVDDLLQSKATIVGRVYFDDCNGSAKDEEGKPDIVGLKNIRLYDQKGNFVLTDENGRFSFSAVDLGTNVIQLDKITLPRDVEVSFCKQNTRYARTAFSQFVDAQGGQIYKANFTVTGNKEKFRIQEKQEIVVPTNLTPEEQQALLVDRSETSPAFRYNSVWLENQDNTFEFVYPNGDFHPGGGSINFGFKYPSNMKPKVYVNGNIVSQLNLLAVDSNSQDTVRLKHYKGVDLDKEINTIKVELYDDNDTYLQEITYQVSYNQRIYKVTAVDDKNRLTSNGLTPSNIVFKLTDKQDKVIGKGQIVSVEISEPFKLYDRGNVRENTALNNINAAMQREDLRIGENGELEVLLQPTLETGRVTVKIFLEGNEFEEFDYWIQAEKREWILVGLAQGSLGYQTVKGNLNKAAEEKIDPDLSTDGKVQFYTKGTINEEWLITAGFDSERRRLNSREELFGQIDLGQRYQVVGDQSQQGVDAASQYPLYLKIEKDQFYTLFGDFNTDLGQSRLLPYSRTLSGFKTAYNHDNFSVQFFAAEDGQTFIRDDIPIFGIGETYKLSGLNLVRGSDTVRIEVRNANNPSNLIQTLPLSRFIDYNIDYQDGTFTFTPSFVLNYNPNLEIPFLIVEAESFGDTLYRKTYGGRIASSFFGGDLKTGVNYIHDGGNIRTQGRGSDGGSADILYKFNNNTHIYGEYAVTRGENRTTVNDFGLLGNNLGSDDSQGAAQLLEFVHKGEQLFTRAYYRNEDNTFGLGTSSSFNVARQSYGAEAVYNFASDDEAEKTTLSSFKKGLSLYARIHQDRDTAGRGGILTTEFGAQKESSYYSTYTGLRFIKEDVAFNFDTGNNIRQSFRSNSSTSQLISGGEIEVIDNRLTLFAGNELPIQDSNSGPSVYGNKSYLGAQSQLFSMTNVIVSHEWIDLNKEEYQNSSASVVMTPLKGLNLSVNGANHILPNERMTSLTSSINKLVKITDNMDINFAFTHREALGGREGIFSTINDIPDYYLPFFMRDVSVRTPINSVSTGYWEDYNLAGIGFINRGSGWNHNMSVQFKDAETEERFSVSTSVLGEITESFTAGITGNYQRSRFKNNQTIDGFKQQLAQHSRNIGLDLNQFADENTLNFLKDSSVAQIVGGTAYRPIGEDGPMVLQRTVLEYSSNTLQDKRFKLVNNFAFEAYLTDKLETNTQYAHKIVQDTFQGQQFDEFINIVGTELRYDLYPDFDISTQGAIFHSSDTSSYDYSYGIGVGYVPTKNVRIRLGYNVQGFNDRDFNSFGYTAQGPFIGFDIKLDQEDAKERLSDFMHNIR